jgi:hypothetical protein
VLASGVRSGSRRQAPGASRARPALLSPLRESLVRFFSGAKRKSETRVCASRRLRWRKRFPRRLERNDRSPQRTFTTRRVTPRARAAPPAHPRTSNPPFRLHHDVVPRRTRRRPPRGPVALHEHGPLDQVLRGVALQRLAGYVSRTSRAFRRTEPLTPASRAPTGTGRTGMFAIPPNNYDFYTEEEKYVLPRRGDETLPDLSSWLRTKQTRAHDVSRTRNQHAFPLLGRFLFFFAALPRTRDKRLSPDRLLPVRPIYVSFF